MRIISGKYKGRRLIAPKNLPVRPTTDMAKESLFNILNNYFNFNGLRVLDLFSGTGNISYEFSSRGAENIISVDGDFGCINYIKKTAKEFDMNITPIKSDVFKFLEKNKNNYDIIFADPPYDLDQKNFEKILDLIFENNLLDTDGMLIIEHSKHTKLSNKENFSFEKTYGGSVFTFFEFEQEEDDEYDEEELIDE
ncbi:MULTISPECIES: 16S rRNA (guanine(966)-N(2))-methyltransferase RsmD [Flavobacterium]|uniref:16S rRNA (Guanine(966)-N(2))-methyltransferase RsmD n=2 Tax=Flavobacterium TaxID=237 RepID=A0A437UE53_9FLAO|nr:MULTISPECIES: 16S rRNA (guanine(966)-N(2))-methyltransferase RsmD [Flavobacterium]OWP83069.1 16S rRNA (guanine(966)-N(2))-methyltransferase RsmD [Flavobacterium davisii]QYS88721.1 16S rRNA (guanine(966)-N(2))-methyltransferase RsmD [Flavobacterium davisii]RVU91881.1 16S rRNA (guanine(966)-N(2))-methyltransferase RsmD [Flavobacterium columnare]SPE78407.1 Ribosomal RNA small subunit methyltransferase D [Flavobacterium columnare]